MRELFDGGLARPLPQRSSLQVDVHVGAQDAGRALEPGKRHDRISSCDVTFA